MKQITDQQQLILKKLRKSFHFPASNIKHCSQTFENHNLLERGDDLVKEARKLGLVLRYKIGDIDFEIADAETQDLLLRSLTLTDEAAKFLASCPDEPKLPSSRQGQLFR
jgi:hypothetical protein